MNTYLCDACGGVVSHPVFLELTAPTAIDKADLCTDCAGRIWRDAAAMQERNNR